MRHAPIIAERQASIALLAESEAQHRALLIEKSKDTINELRHAQFCRSSERGVLLDQLELQVAEFAKKTLHKPSPPGSGGWRRLRRSLFERRTPARRPLPAHLPRERVVYPVPSVCRCCGDGKQLEDRRGCDRDAGADPAPVEGDPARARGVLLPSRPGDLSRSRRRPLHPIARGGAPKLCPRRLFMGGICHSTAGGQVPPYARVKGIDLDVSTLADGVGAAPAQVQAPPRPVLSRHMFFAAAYPILDAYDTTVPVLAKGKTRTVLLCGDDVRDDRPFAGPDPPAAVLFCSRDRGGEHPCNSTR